MRSLTMTGLLMLTCWIGSALAAQVPSDDSQLIERCNQDLRLSLKVNPDPFHLHIPLPPGKLDLLTIVR
jgi:hypothetical protein